MSKDTRTRLLIAGLLATTALILSSTLTVPAPPPTPAFTDSEKAHVVRVIDGDTLVAAPDTHIRFIGINAPEIAHGFGSVDQPGGQAAASYVRGLLEGKDIYLVPEAHGALLDKYGRSLDYIYLTDGTDVDYSLVLNGWAKAYTRFPFSHRKEYTAAQKWARGHKLGVWGTP